jgi:hypothetical protein
LDLVGSDMKNEQQIEMVIWLRSLRARHPRVRIRSSFVPPQQQIYTGRPEVEVHLHTIPSVMMTDE